MNIALIGYGKMGKIIESIAVRRGHHIALKISSTNRHDFNEDNLKSIDAAIEFTHPGAAYDNVIFLLKNNIPTICGTTGWNNKLPEVQKFCLENNGALLCASNFSLGVNIFFEMNQQLAKIMNHYKDYEVSIEETHHTQKKDAPSGTAITIAEQIIQNIDSKQSWSLTPQSPEELKVVAYREEDVPGTHKVIYHSAIDDLTLTHIAHSREGFALGAVVAAEFIAGKKGIFSMQDVLFQ